MKLTNKEKEDLKLSIQGENVMIKRLRSMMMSFLMIACTGLILALTVLKSYPGWRTAGYAVGGIFGVLTLMCLLSLRNGRKHLLASIQRLESSK